MFALYYFGALPVIKEWWKRSQAENAAAKARMAQLSAELLQEQRFGVVVSASPEVVLDQATEYMTRTGYGIQSRTGNTATFARDEGADSCLGCFLMLFLLVPGILYLLLANKTLRLTVAAFSHEGGSRVVIGGDDVSAKNALTDWLRSLS